MFVQCSFYNKINMDYDGLNYSVWIENKICKLSSGALFFIIVHPLFHSWPAQKLNSQIYAKYTNLHAINYITRNELLSQNAVKNNLSWFLDNSSYFTEVHRNALAFI